MIKTTALGRYKYLFSKIEAKAINAIRVRAPMRPLTVLGGYHGENTGDWAMGTAIRAAATSQNIHARTLAMRDCERLKSARNVIIGGGAVATPEALKRVAEIWSSNPFRVALVGVDFSANMAEFSPQIQKMCQAATSIGLRHKSQLQRVRDWSKNDQTYVHADVAFSLELPDLNAPKSRTLTMNVLPLFRVHAAGRFQAGSALSAMYQRNKSKFHDKIEHIAAAYVGFVRRIANAYSDKGYQIVHIPFAPEDDAFARAILPKRTRFVPFSLSFARCEQEIASSELFVPTRFHAVVAGIRTRTPILPIAYAGKVEGLLTDFGVTPSQIIDRERFEDNDVNFAFFSPEEAAISESMSSATVAIERAVREAMGTA